MVSNILGHYFQQEKFYQFSIKHYAHQSDFNSILISDPFSVGYIFLPNIYELK